MQPVEEGFFFLVRFIYVQGGPFDDTEKGPLDGTAVRFSANSFWKMGVSMLQRDFQKKIFCVYMGFYFEIWVLITS